MVDVRSFRALRPPPPIAAAVASPPYDVVSTTEARALAAGNPKSFLHVSRPEIDLPEGTDEHADEVYTRGARNLAAFVADGTLVLDAQPHLYVYAQRMGEHHQVGVVATASVADYAADRIKKHEKTRADKEDDRTRHIEALSAHDEPVFLTYLARPAIDAAVRTATVAPPVYDITTGDGVEHRLWVLSPAATAELVRLFGEVDALYVADGHHRSAAAERVHRGRSGDGRDHDAFLAVIFPHDQMKILPYNRVVRDRRGRDAATLVDALSAAFDVEPATDAADASPRQRGHFGVYAGHRWYRARTRIGSPRSSSPVEALDCSVCQTRILSAIFGIDDPRRDDAVDFVGGIRGTAELERRVDSGAFDLAIHLFPTRIEELMRVSDAGLLMPPKSTWFEPKLRSGLFVHVF